MPQLGPFDLLLMALGTPKLSRTISKDAVTSPLRAPFTRYQETGGPDEVMEEVRKTGPIRHAIGELITCPLCLDMWIATGFALGMVFAPRFTRLVAFTFAALTGADFLQLGFTAAQQAQECAPGEATAASRPDRLPRLDELLIRARRPLDTVEKLRVRTAAEIFNQRKSS